MDEGAVAWAAAAMFRWGRARHGHRPCAILALPGPAAIGVVPLRATETKRRIWKIVVRVDGNPHSGRAFMATSRRAVRQVVQEELQRLGVPL